MDDTEPATSRTMYDKLMDNGKRIAGSYLLIVAGGKSVARAEGCLNVRSHLRPMVVDCLLALLVGDRDICRLPVTDLRNCETVSCRSPRKLEVIKRPMNGDVQNKYLLY